MSHARRLRGWLCLAPAVGLLGWQYALPVIATAGGSLYASRFGRRGGQWVGPGVYRELDLLGPVLVSALMVLPAAALAGGLGIAVGLLGPRAPDRSRRLIRILLGVLVVSYAPVGVTLSVTSTELLDPALGALAGLVVVLLPLGVALTATVTMALTTPSGQVPRPAAVVAGLLGVVTVVALGLQTFSVPLVTGLGTVAVQIYDLGFVRQEYGRAYAVSTVLLVLLAVLGVLATVVLLVAGVRVELSPAPRRPGARFSPGLLVAAGVVLLSAGVAHGWVGGLFVPENNPDPLSVQVVTWLPTAIVVVAQVLVAALAAYGIAILRPLGDRSRWLLLVFAPALFVGLTPLMAAYVARLPGGRGLDDLDAFAPMPLNVPLLFALTLVLDGLREPLTDWTERSRARQVVRAVGSLGALVSLVVLAQTLAWSLLIARIPAFESGPTVLLGDAASDVPLAQTLATPVLLLGLLAVIASVAMVRLDGLQIRVGPAAPSDPLP